MAVIYFSFPDKVINYGLEKKPREVNNKRWQTLPTILGLGFSKMLS